MTRKNKNQVEHDLMSKNWIPVINEHMSDALLNGQTTHNTV